MAGRNNDAPADFFRGNSTKAAAHAPAPKRMTNSFAPRQMPMQAAELEGEECSCLVISGTETVGWDGNPGRHGTEGESMNNRPCPYEDSVIQAMRTSQWSEALPVHVSQCENCSEVEQAFYWMGNVSASWESNAPAPDAGLIWIKAQLADVTVEWMKRERPSV